MIRRLLRMAGAEARDVALRARDARFATALRVDAGAPAVILSPHLDDAVLDCWSVLSAPGPVTVVNVFAALPPHGPPGPWERLVGAHDPRGLMQERLAEDAEALALAGRTPTALAFADASNRPLRSRPTHAQLDRALRATAPTVSRVYAPAVLGAVHADHLVVRAYALELARAGVPVTLYADLPYAIVYGWPAWVTGTPPDPRLDVDAFWDATPHRAAAPAGAKAAEVVELDAEQAALKLTAMRTYRTQFAMLDRGIMGILSNPATHRYEVFWPVRS